MYGKFLTHMFACPFCSLHCDDLEISLEEQNLTSLFPICPKGINGFSNALSSLASNKKDKSSENWKEDWTRTIQLIKTAHHPLVIIGGGISYTAQRLAAALARQINAWADSPASLGGCALPWTAVEVGLTTCTLGELRANAEILILLDIHLEEDYPRFTNRIWRPGTQQPELLEINSHELFQITDQDPNEPLIKTLVHLRLCFSNFFTEPVIELCHTIGKMLDVSRGAIVFSSRLVSGGRMLTIELFGLLHKISVAHRCNWQALYLPGGSNWPGASQALSAESGYPCAVHFSPRQVKFSPIMYSATNLIEQNAPDLVIGVGDIGWLSTKALNRLRETPTIVINSVPLMENVGIWLPIALPGVDDKGIFLRADNVPVHLSPLIASQNPSAEYILQNIMEEFK